MAPDPLEMVQRLKLEDVELLHASARTLVTTTDPWHAEALFFLSGNRVPSVWPSSHYISARHDPTIFRTEILYIHDRGRAMGCQEFSEFFFAAMPKDYPLKVLRTLDYLSFEQMASHRAAILVPFGNVMQMALKELTNMRLPTLLPDARFLARQPFSWWLDRFAGPTSFLTVEERLRMTFPPLPTGFVRPHPFPFLVPNLFPGPEKLYATLYWIRFLDYFHIPGLIHFESVPRLLELMLDDRLLRRASRELGNFTQSNRALSRAFWRDGVARLLG